MNKTSILFAFIVSFLLPNVTHSQLLFDYSEQNLHESTERFKKLQVTLSNSEHKINVSPELSDFKSKAQQGLNFMKPGAIVQNLKCEIVSNWSPSFEDELNIYLLNVYKQDIKEMGSDWITGILGQWRQERVRIGFMSWEIIFNGESSAVSSIAVFDGNWNVLFDTELVNFIVKATRIEHTQSILHDEEKNAAINSVNNVDSKITEKIS